MNPEQLETIGKIITQAGTAAAAVLALAQAIKTLLEVADELSERRKKRKRLWTPAVIIPPAPWDSQEIEVN